MNIKQLAIASIFAGGIFVMGCAPSMVDENWGRSVETARYNQTLNPEAQKNLTPVDEMDGQSAINILESYRQGFSKSEETAGYDVKETGIGMKQ